MPTQSTADLIASLHVVTLKWGPRYSHTEVNRVYHATRRFGLAGSTFHCFTDNAEGLADGIVAHELLPIDLPERVRWGPWRKISLFGPAFPLQGPCLYFDIDSVIVGALGSLLDDWTGRPRFIKGWVGGKTLKRPLHDGINSSMMLFTAQSCPEVYERFEADKAWALRTFPGDQGFVYHTLKDRCEFFPPRLTASFKKHCIPRFPLNFVLRPKPPRGVSAVFFHGRPDPEEARRGFRTGKLKYRCRPTPWVPAGDQEPGGSISEAS